MSDKNLGSIQISDDVLSVIAGTAALEAEGVSSTVGNVAGEWIGKISKKNLGKGVIVLVDEDGLVVNANISVKHSYNLQDVAKKTQEKIKNALENMTGKTVKEVNVTVSGVDFPKVEKPFDEVVE